MTSVPDSVPEPAPTGTLPLTIENCAMNIDKIVRQLEEFFKILQGFDKAIYEMQQRDIETQKRMMLIELFGQKQRLNTLIHVMMATILVDSPDGWTVATAGAQLSDEAWRALKNKHGILRSVTKKEFFDESAAVYAKTLEVGLMTNKDGFNDVVARVERWGEAISGESWTERFVLPANRVAVSNKVEAEKVTEKE